MAVEKAKSSKAIATSLPPDSPNIPWENAFAVNSAESINDKPLNLKRSSKNPSDTENVPLNKRSWSS